MDFNDDIFQKIKYLLELDEGVFRLELEANARELAGKKFGNGIFVSGLLAISNICCNNCTYCGLRAARSRDEIKRFRLSLDDIKHSTDHLRKNGLDRIFFISGEDPLFPMDDILEMIRYASEIGFHITLGLGVYPENILREMHDAGANCYSLKFETSNRQLFSKIKPGVDFDERLACIRNIKRTGMELGSGNIVGLQGQTIDDLAADILLMHELDCDWAPVVPYIPAPGTPMGETTSMGDVALTLREITILRIIMPDLIITAGQPTQDSSLGFADPLGNRAALNAGANILFVDLTPQAVRQDFDITPGRILPGLASVEQILQDMGLERIRRS